MFKILQKAANVGIATVPYPDAPAVISEHFRGRPEFDLASWRDARPAAERCPTGAISLRDEGEVREVTIDLGLCTFCGECAGESVRMTRDFECATRDRAALVTKARDGLNPDGTHDSLISSTEAMGSRVRDAIHKTFGRSLAIRQVDAGSCNGCEGEI